MLNNEIQLLEKKLITVKNRFKLSEKDEKKSTRL